MAFNYSCGQFNDAFKPSRLGNWSDASKQGDRQCRQPVKQFRGSGYLDFISDEHGRLLPHVRERIKKKANHWGLPVLRVWDEICEKPLHARPYANIDYHELPRFFKDQNQADVDCIAVDNCNDCCYNENDEFENLRLLKLPIIWLYGYPKKGICLIRKHFIYELTKSLGFKYIDMDQIMFDWGRRYIHTPPNLDPPALIPSKPATAVTMTSLDSSTVISHWSKEIMFEGQGQGDAMLGRKQPCYDEKPYKGPCPHATNEPELRKQKREALKAASRHIQRFITIMNRIMPDPNEAYTTQGLIELLKCVLMESYPCRGYIIDGYPINKEEAKEFEETFWPVAGGIYFYNKAWETGSKVESEVSEPVLFRRIKIYNENEVESVVRSNAYKSIKIHYSPCVGTRELEELNQSIGLMLEQYYNFLRGTFSPSSAKPGEYIAVLGTAEKPKLENKFTQLRTRPNEIELEKQDEDNNNEPSKKKKSSFTDKIIPRSSLQSPAPESSESSLPYCESCEASSDVSCHCDSSPNILKSDKENNITPSCLCGCPAPEESTTPIPETPTPSFTLPFSKSKTKSSKSKTKASKSKTKSCKSCKSETKPCTSKTKSCKSKTKTELSTKHSETSNVCTCGPGAEATCTCPDTQSESTSSLSEDEKNNQKIKFKDDSAKSKTKSSKSKTKSFKSCKSCKSKTKPSKSKTKSSKSKTKSCKSKSKCELSIKHSETSNVCTCGSGPEPNCTCPDSESDSTSSLSEDEKNNQKIKPCQSETSNGCTCEPNCTCSDSDSDITVSSSKNTKNNQDSSDISSTCMVSLVDTRSTFSDSGMDSKATGGIKEEEDKNNNNNEINNNTIDRSDLSDTSSESDFPEESLEMAGTTKESPKEAQFNEPSKPESEELKRTKLSLPEIPFVESDETIDIDLELKNTSKSDDNRNCLGQSTSTTTQKIKEMSMNRLVWSQPLIDSQKYQKEVETVIDNNDYVMFPKESISDKSLEKEYDHLKQHSMDTIKFQDKVFDYFHPHEHRIKQEEKHNYKHHVPLTWCFDSPSKEIFQYQPTKGAKVNPATANKEPFWSKMKRKLGNAFGIVKQTQQEPHNSAKDKLDEWSKEHPDGWKSWEKHDSDSEED